MAWKRPITPLFEPNLAFDWKMAKLAHKGRKIGQQVLAGSCGGELVWLKPGLLQSIPHRAQYFPWQSHFLMPVSEKKR